MTKRELSQLYWLNKEIASDERRLAELEARATSASVQSMDGMPRAAGNGDALTRCVAEIVDLKAIVSAKKQQRIFERSRLERYIEGINDSVTRQIFRARFVDGLNWDDTAEALGGYNTPEGVRKRVYRYLRSTEETN